MAEGCAAHICVKNQRRWMNGEPVEPMARAMTDDSVVRRAVSLRFIRGLGFLPSPDRRADTGSWSSGWLFSLENSAKIHRGENNRR